jgi:asparagine N-glycosylation enzyme membrane subunit Stt3
VVVSSIFSGVEGMARMAGLSEKFVVVDRDAFGSDSYKPLKPFFDSLHSRLYLGYGSTTEIAGYRLEPLSHFRLLSESEWGEPILGMPKTIMAAFEAVQGGRVRGRTRPLSPVVLSLDLLTNLDRRFRYVRRTVSDREGEFEFSVPYSTDPAAGRTRAVGPYRVKMPQGILHTEVSERDVRQGRTVTVN